MSMEESGKSILNLRQNANMTQEELALRMGVTPQAISKWERGQSLPDITLFAQLCKALNVSADILLGLENKSDEKSSSGNYSEEVLKNLRYCLEPLVLSFGKDLVQIFLENDYMGLVAELRIQLSWEGILLPVVRLKDDLKLEPDEFVVKVYDKVLYRERVPKVDGAVLEHMIQILGRIVRENYGEILSRDLMKDLTDNLKLSHPALIEGIIPEKISYGLLQEVYRHFLARGNSPKYLSKLIENLENDLYTNPEISAEQLVERVCRRLSRLSYDVN